MNVDSILEQNTDTNEVEQNAPIDLSALELVLVGGGTGTVVFG